MRARRVRLVVGIVQHLHGISLEGVELLRGHGSPLVWEGVSDEPPLIPDFRRAKKAWWLSQAQIATANAQRKSKSFFVSTYVPAWSR